MRKKLFTFLLALAASVGLSWATVITWDQSKLSSMAMNIESGSGSKASDGIEVTAVSTGEFVRFCYGGAIEIGNGEGSGGGYLTFTSSVGNIAQIDIYHSGAGEWRNANGDWISPYYINDNGGIFTWSGTPAASVTLTGDAPRYIYDITSIEFTIEDGGGSTQAGLQVTELQVPGSWQDNPTMLSTSDMPGFVAITEAEATAWDAAPAGDVVLIFAFEGDGATSLYFKNGVYQATQAHNITYEDIYAWYSEGDKIFYTGGGSTPTPTPAESVTVVFEANNNQKEVEVTLPHTFACDFQNGNGELDGIIQELYALQYGGYCQAFNAPTATGNAAVTASKDGNNHYIAISEAFEGTATVTGNYIKYLDTEHTGNTSVDYTLTISVQGSTLDPEPATGLQVVEVTSDIYDGWNSNSNTFTVDALPGFQAVTFDEAKEWTGVPTSGTAALVYRTNGDYARVIHFFDGDITGDYDLETSFNQMYENITIFGNRIFYTAGGGSTPTPDPEPTPTSSGDGDKLAGAFSVGGDKVVYFSKANLQATTADNGSTWTWGFAENQWDYVGNSAANNAINGGGTVSENGAVDLFGWSSNANDYYGIDNSTDLTNYDGNFQDWGAKVGSDWHALNGAQWEYLLLTREPGSLAGGTSNPRFTRATILTDGTAPSQDIFGLILFPDNFNDGGEYIDGVTWNGINSHSSYVSPTYCTTAGWATLESMGCVFLPAPGWRSGNEVTNVGAFGIYWSSTKYSEEDASCIYFSNTDVAAFHSYITTGASVRLVSETAPAPTPTSFTFPAGTTIYYDFTAYGNGINVYAPGAPMDWYSSSAKIIPVTLSSDWEISESTNLFKSEASGWNFVNGTILPTDGQNMIVSTNGVDYAWGTHVPAYTVAGEPAVAFGTPIWAPTNTDNDMVKQSNGTYKWEKEDVELAIDAVVSFKVCQDHGWDVAYPKDNFNHTIPADGIYTLTITFDPNAEGDKVAIDATKTADVVVAQTAEMKGFGDWNTGIALENINEGAAARVTKNLAAGTHEFKMIINDGWRGKVGATITRANNTVAEIVDNPNESNITLTADIPGDYTFTWTYAENTLSVEFPSLVVYVQNLIAAIGEVTLESGDAINAARTAYDALSAGDKEAVSNYDVLTDAEAAYALLHDQVAANAVKDLIDAIDNPVVYTQACKDKIDAARNAYDALTDAQKTLVGDEYAQKLADAEAAYDAFIVYTVAGEPAVAFGTPTWAPTNTDNDMVKQSNGTYKWEKEDVELAKDAVVSFKVCQDHGWDVAYPKDNFNHTIPADGIYTLTITFDPNAEGDKVAIAATKTADVVVAQTAEMKGFGDWNTGIALENINEGAAARVTKNLAAGAHEFKMIINDGWRGKVGATITRANNTVAEIVDNPNESNITLTADIPGDYTFTWTYAENTLSVEFPSLVVYVQNLIDAIGEVNLESGDAINAARTAYDNLLDADQKQAVNNYDVLEAAEAAYAALAQAAADQLAANTVKGLIDAIDNPVVYTNDCKAKIDAARAAYDALTDAQKTLVGDEYAQKLADAEAAYDAFIVYTVAGEPEALFGSFWNIGDTNNDMVKQSNGTYKWEKTDVALAAGTAKFKIIKDHVTYEYPTSNYVLNIAEDGLYTVTIIYDPKAAEDRITATATKTGEVVIVHTAEMKGSWNNWTDGLELENINEGAAARATKILTPGTYEFKMIIDGSWLGEASTTFTRNENAKAEIGGDEDNLNLTADIPGCYTFTWTYETNTLEIGYPTYLDADFAINFMSDPYTKVGGGDLPAGVLVEGSMNTGDPQHGYRLPVITIPVTAGNYKVMMGTCTYSNQDATIKTEDNSYTYATLATNNGTCYHNNTTANVVGAIFTVPTDQIIKVYGAEYTPFFSIEKMAAVPAFTDFEINFQSDPYGMISGAKPEGTVIAGSFHDGQHGYQNVEATVPVKAGKYRLTLGACGYGNGAGNVMSETNVELASFNQKLAENDKCYHQDPANNIVSMIFDVDQDQTITIDCGQYTPYMKLEAVTAYQVSFALSDAEGSVPAAVDVTVGEGITMPVNKTMYKEGYTLTGWSDGVNTYPIGESFTPANDVVLTPVFTANEADLLNASTDVNVKWYFGGDNGAPTTSYEGTSGLLVAQATIGDKTVDVKLAIDATSGKFAPQPTTEWAQVKVGTIFTYPYKEGMTVDVHTYSGNVTYYIADGNVTCGTNDYYSFIEVTYPASAPTTAVVIGDPNNASEVETFLSTYDGQTIDELIIDRPVLNNMYNTLCLPFDMNAAQIAASSLNGVEIREFTGASVEGTTLNLSVSDPVNAVVAGRPYFVKYSAASQLDNLHFEDVTINNALLDNMAVTFDGVTFKGTFTPFVMPNGLNFQGGYLFLGQNNQLFWPNTDNPLKPFRAYFYVDVESSTPGNAPKYRGMPARIVEGKNVATGVENAQSANQSTKVIVNGQLIIIKNDVRYNAQGQVVK